MVCVLRRYAYAAYAARARLSLTAPSPVRALHTIRNTEPTTTRRCRWRRWRWRCRSDSVCFFTLHMKHVNFYRTERFNPAFKHFPSDKFPEHTAQLCACTCACVCVCVWYFVPVCAWFCARVEARSSKRIKLNFNMNFVTEIASSAD